MTKKAIILRSSAAVLVATGLGLGCAAAAGGGATSEQQRIAALSASDVGLCFPSSITPPSAVNTEVLTGLLVAVRPAVMECLVSPQSRGAAQETTVNLKTTAGGGKLQHNISGPNLTPEGAVCVKEALDRHFAAVQGFAALAAAANPPVSGEAQVTHKAGVSPTVRLGENESSDVAGAVRLAQTTWCECYEPWKAAAPHPLNATLSSQGGMALTAKFEPAADPASQKVAECLSGKISDVKFTARSSQINVPYTFMFVHSGNAAPLTDVPPEVQIRQLDGVRTQRAARAVIALGGRMAAAQAYDALGKKYNAAPDSVPVEDLTKGCAALLATDDAWLETLNQQLEIDEQTLALVQQLKAKDAEWGRAEEASKNAVDVTKQDIETAKQMKTGDAGACPRDAK
ncbi:hypothetical protein [Chondromyces apiculatus]|nr:hypothetical protein [Chondromyces apiculatus]